MPVLANSRPRHCMCVTRFVSGMGTGDVESPKTKHSQCIFGDYHDDPAHLFLRLSLCSINSCDQKMFISRRQNVRFAMRQKPQDLSFLAIVTVMILLMFSLWLSLCTCSINLSVQLILATRKCSFLAGKNYLCQVRHEAEVTGSFISGDDPAHLFLRLSLILATRKRPFFAGKIHPYHISLDFWHLLETGRIFVFSHRVKVWNILSGIFGVQPNLGD